MTVRQTELARWILISAFPAALCAYEALPGTHGQVRGFYLILTLAGLNLCGLVVGLAQIKNAHRRAYAGQNRASTSGGEAMREADARAYELLRQYLTDAQLGEYATCHGFIVRGSRGGSYVVGDAQMVRRIDRPGRYCLVPAEPVPDADRMLAQKLLLESDERLFLKTAIRQ